MDTIYWFLVVLAAVHSALSVTDPTIEDIINQIFEIGTDPQDIAPNAPKPKGCVSVKGRGVGCYSCDFCNNSLSQPRYYLPPITLELNNANCTKTASVCCTPHASVSNIRLNNQCGKQNPDGVPRARRKRLRSMLQAEFPWRAWVYSKTSSTPLCAATYIHEDKKVLLTLASCVRAYSADTLTVAFVKNQNGEHSAVSDVIVHESYNPGDDDNNNIAILRLVSLEKTPPWSAPACLPDGPPTPVTLCISTSEAEYQLESIIPIRSSCKTENGVLSESLMCAMGPAGDYEPERAAGLYCSDGMPAAFTVHGLYKSMNQNIGLYVDIWHFMPWLNKKLNIN